MRTAWTFGLLMLAVAGHVQDDAGHPAPRIRFASEAPVIDGDLGDPCWKQADTLTGFTVPGSLALARDQSEVRILFDDTRLYIGLKASESNPELMSRKTGVFSAESYEIFVQPDPEGETYYQIAVSVIGEIYTGRMKSKWSPLIEVKTSSDGDSWTAELAVPLADMEMAAPGEGQEIRFNICRNDWAAPGGAAEHTAGYSSFSLLEIADFHVPEVWSTGVVTRELSQPQVIVNESPYKNLLENPEFDVAANDRPVGWSSDYWDSGEVQRRETMAMSGEWIVAGKGNTYVVVRQNVDLTPGATYTVRLKARRFGECAVGVHQGFKDGSSGPVLWNCPLTTNFRYYYATFTAVKDTKALYFYRLGPRTETDGVEFASIHLFEGKLSPLSIRRYTRTGLTKRVAGTELPIPPNFYGSRGADRKLRVLAIAYRLYTSRELEEVFAGLDLEADILLTTGWNQDTYYVEGDPKVVEERLEKGEYDLYILGRVAVGRIGEELAKTVFANVEEGAGFLIGSLEPERDGRFKLISEHEANPVPADHYLKRGMPWALYPEGTPIGEILEAKSGEGRIVVAGTGAWELQVRPPNEMLTSITFPHKRYSRAWLARMLYYTADRVPSSIEGIEVAGGKAQVRLAGEAQPAELAWHLADKNGKLVSEGKAQTEDMSAEIVLPPLVLSGDHVLALWLKDGDGGVLDYSAHVVNHDGPRIAKLESAQEFYTGVEQGEFSATLVDAEESMTLGWALEDFSGRILGSGETAAAETVAFKVPLEPVYTNLARLWVTLRADGAELDRRRFAVYLPDRDGRRLLTDFNVTAWPEGCTNPDAAPFINRALETIGVRAKNQTWHELSFNDGLGSTTNLGCGEFWASVPKEEHIRKPSLRDPKVLAEIADKAGTRAETDRKYGPYAVQVVDEPESSPRWDFVEVDAHPESLKVYRERMSEKYGSIDRFNQRCSTDYGSFEELDLVTTEDARQRENFAEFVEWRNYMVDTWVEAFRLVIDTYHAGNPDAPISMENSFGQRALNGNDYWKLLTQAGFGFANEYTDVISNDPVKNFSELYRSFRPDMRVWGFIGYGFSRDASQFKPWWFALHRFGGLSYFATAGEDPGEVTWNLVSMPGFGLSQRGQLLKDGGLSELMTGLGKVFLEYDWAKRDIAILYSQPSMLVSWCRGTEERDKDLLAGSPYHDYFHSREGARHMLEELLFQYDFVAPEQIAEGKLDSYKVLVLPHIEAMSDGTVAKINDFVERGGTVITDIVPAEYDELGTPREEPPFAAMGGSDLARFEGTFDDKDGPQRERMSALLEELGVAPILGCGDAVATPGREAMHFARGDMSVYGITRDYRRSTDTKQQEFVFPAQGHVYDLREGTYLGETDRVSCAIPNAGTEVYGHYPYKITGLKVECPSRVQGGTDLVADIRVQTSAEAGHHVLHVEVLPPEGEARWFMKRNVAAPGGEARFSFRMAENDPVGKWNLRVTDVMSGETVNQSFSLR